MNIKPNELRLGNLIYENIYDIENNCRIDKVIIVDANTIAQAVQNTNTFNPIPLTPELLEKAGFEKGLTMARGKDFEAYSLSIGNDSFLEYREEIGKDNQVFKTWYIISEFAHVGAEMWNQPAYLHQLQNLVFALTGKQIQINL